MHGLERPRTVLSVAAWLLTGCLSSLPGYTASPDYAISAVVPFEELSSTVATARTAPATLAISAAPGEFEPVSFVLTAFRSMKNLTLTPVDLTAGRQVIPRTNVDVRVVKVWTQAGRGPRKTKPITLGELLVKDDAAPFLDSYDAEGHYFPPDLPNGSSVRTDIAAGKSKQFWITVKVPQDAPPGDYRGGVRVESPESGIQGMVGLTLTVLPIQLKEPRQDRIIYYRGSLDPARGGDFVGGERFARELQDIREHGFTGVTLYDSGEPYVRRAVELVARAGFLGPVIFTEPNTKFLEIARSYGIPALFYGVDEPNDPRRIREHLEKSARIRAGGGRVVVAIDRSWALRLADTKDLNDPLDVTNLALTPDVFRWAYDGGPARDRGRFPKSWYYWQIMMEKPGLHRLLTGFFLWRSRLDGIFPYVYQHIRSPYSPFDDFAPWVGDYRVHMATYPSKDGSIPTLQWEAIREGIDDLRYLSTLESLIEKAKTTGPPRASEAIRRASRLLDELTRKVVLTEYRLGTDEILNPIPGVGPRDYASWRKEIIERILDLQNAIGDGVKQSPARRARASRARRLS